MFFHSGEMAAVDINSFTIYISQQIGEDTKFSDLVGKLSFANPNYKLYFAYDEYFDKLAAAVRESHPFKLLVTDGSGIYTEYYVIFTTLPLVRMNGTPSYVNEEGREVYSGDICLWDPCDRQSGRYSVKTSQLEWHVRGDSQKACPKKPYKLSLKKSDGTDRNLNFLGLGSDDDWILNSMSLEDLNFRDKLVMDLWNELCKETPYNYPMDSGEYVEVINNGVYSGLYLMQRRVDEKYLGLSGDTVLLKGRKEFADPDNPQYYTPVGESRYEQQAQQIMQQFEQQQNFDKIDIDNWIDLNVFINWAYMPDNIRRHNIYYVLENVQSEPKIKMILWDTDMTFGISWLVDRYAYDPWIAEHLMCIRPEYQLLGQMYPDLDQRFAQRYNQLRQGVLSNENVLEKVNGYRQLFADSGAFERDKTKWDSYHNGADTIEVFYDYIRLRSQYLDGCYA